jgi:hypothetical protein
MKKYIGIWVDHKKAVIVNKRQPEQSYEKDAKVTVTAINSEVERNVRLTGGARTRNVPWGPQDVAVNGKIEARQKQQLKNFYQRIIEFLKDADKIMIMGPGEAKLELKKEISKSKVLALKIVGVQTCDKMTNNQIAAEVQSYFDKK